MEKQWALPLAQRVRQGYDIEALSLHSLKVNAFKMSCQTNDSRFRDGDLLVLHRGNPKGPETIQSILDYDDETCLDFLITDGNPFLLKEYPRGLIGPMCPCECGVSYGRGGCSRSLMMWCWWTRPNSLLPCGLRSCKPWSSPKPGTCSWQRQ